MNAIDSFKCKYISVFFFSSFHVEFIYLLVIWNQLHFNSSSGLSNAVDARCVHIRFHASDNDSERRPKSQVNSKNSINQLKIVADFFTLAIGHFWK